MAADLHFVVMHVRQKATGLTMLYFALLLGNVLVFFVVFQACELPLFEYIADKMSALCYERAWYTKLGGYDVNSVAAAAAAAADISSAKPEMMFR